MTPELILFSAAAFAIVLLALAIVIVIARVLWHTEQVRTESANARRIEADRLERFTEKLLHDVTIAHQHALERQAKDAARPSGNGIPQAIPMPGLDLGEEGDFTEAHQYGGGR